MLSALVKPPTPSDDATNSRRSASGNALRGRLWAWLPMLILALALATLFVFNSDRERFYAPLLHDTAKSLAIAENLSPDHRFRMFRRLTFDEDGEPAYIPYHRFPIGGFALIKIVILPFGDDLAMKVFAARMLMLALFSAAAFLAYHAIARIASNRWIALTAVMIAFSSYYVLRYSNWVSNEFMVDLFAVMLVFHGMVIFAQDGRFRQLAIKTCVALLLGWHVYAFLVPFVALGLSGELAHAIKARRNAHSADETAKSRSAQDRYFGALHWIGRSPYIRLGVLSLLLGVAVLTFNFLSEYDALNGEVPLAELPSVKSFAGRAWDANGLSFDDGRAWGGFVRQQFYRITGASIPHALVRRHWGAAEAPPNEPPLPLAAMGLLFVGACFAGLLFVRRRRIPLAVLALSGPCWALLARGNVASPHHLFEAIYYVGVPLTLVALLLIGARSLGGSRFLPIAAVGAAMLFTLSAYQSVARGPELERSAERQQAIFSDAAAIRKITQGKNVYVAQSDWERTVLYGDRNPLEFYLSGSRITYDAKSSATRRDFVVIPYRDEQFQLLTPDNRIVFLYGPADPADIERARFDALSSGVSGEPAARAAYDVYLANGSLVYFKEQCDDIGPKFFLRIYPEDTDELPKWRKRHGSDNLDFFFPLWGIEFDGKCVISVPLPDYGIAGIRTGQFIGGERKLWETAFPFDPGAIRAAYHAADSREPTVRAAFDLYLDENEQTLTYVREECAASDAAAPFFLHVTPQRANDLPDDRREFGFDNHDFDFRLRGIAFDGKCVAQVPLPEYGVASIWTGQWERGAGEIWDAEISFGG